MALHRTSRGFTLIEMMVVVAIAAVMLTVVVSSFTDLLARRRLEGAASELSTDLQFARAQAVTKNAPVVLTTTSSGYMVYPPTAIPDSNLVAPKTHWGPPPYGASAPNVPYKNLTLPAGVTLDATTVTYDQLRAMAAASAVIAVSSTRTTGQLQVTVSPMGRVSICSPSGSLKGYSSC